MRADGTTIYPATAAASACLTPEEGLPAGSLPAGQQYSGTVVLDVPETTGSIVHRPDPLAAGAVVGLLTRRVGRQSRSDQVDSRPAGRNPSASLTATMGVLLSEL